MVSKLMKCLLAGWGCTGPLVATAQYTPFSDTQRFRLLSPLPVYSSLAGTAHAAPLVYQPGQLVTVTGYVGARWCVLSEYVAYCQVNRYFLLKSLATTPEKSPEPLPKRQHRQLMKKK